MSVVDWLLSVTVIGIALGGAVVVSDWFRAQTSWRQTRTTLRQLRQALVNYEKALGAWPPAPTPAALEAMLAQPDAAEALRVVSHKRDPAGGLAVVDGYGRPIRYVVQSQDGRSEADFVSAGPDGQLGDPFAEQAALRRAAADDVFGAEVEVIQP